jgi:Predicted membrane protein
MTCCGSSCQIDGELGRRLERGEITSIPTEELRFGYQGVRKKICSSCGFTTTEDYQYCPKCGEKFTD